MGTVGTGTQRRACSPTSRAAGEHPSVLPGLQLRAAFSSGSLTPRKRGKKGSVLLPESSK